MVERFDVILSTIESSSEFPFSKQPSPSLGKLTGQAVLPGLGCPLSGLRSSQLARTLIIAETKRAGEPGSAPFHPSNLGGQLVCQHVDPHHAGHLSSWLDIRKCHPSFVSLGGVSLPLLAKAGVRGSWTNAPGAFGRNPPSRQEGK